MNWRFRTNWRGKLILQRRVENVSFDFSPSGYYWRDASSTDLLDYAKDIA